MSVYILLVLMLSIKPGDPVKLDTYVLAYGDKEACVASITPMENKFKALNKYTTVVAFCNKEVVK